MATPQQITIGANTYSLVPMPSSPAAKSVQLTAHDTVATVQSPFTQQTQTQTWPGGDWWEAQITLPPMHRSQAAAWQAWLTQLRGMAGVFQLGIDGSTKPQGFPAGSVPVVDGSVATNNKQATTVLYTKGWNPSSYRLLLPGDYLQIEYRLYMCLDSVASDANGNAQINVYPSIRETPADGTAITLQHPKGLFRLSSNARTWNHDVTNLTSISFTAAEVR